MGDQPAVPSILAYTQDVPARMPSTYYPGPGPVRPMSRHHRHPHYEDDSDSDGSDDDRGSRRMVLAVCLALAVVLIIIILYYMFAPRTLARGLTRCGWTVYLLEGCTFCHKQMRILDGFDRYVLCGKGGARLKGYTELPPKNCADIQSFPYWFNVRTGEERVGFQDTAALQKMAQW